MDYTRFRGYRKLLDITIDDIALEIGISSGYINRIERGYVKEIKNPKLRAAFEAKLQELERRVKAKMKEVAA